MKLRHILLVLASLALVATGCGSDSSDSKSEKQDDAPKTKTEKAAAKDRDNKEDAVKRAEKAYEDDKGDVGACRNLAMSYIALASPASAPDPETQVELPKDRDESLKKAVGTLEACAKADSKDRDVKQMLASTYMATSEYDKAAPLLKQLADTARGQERANAYYAWGLAASNAQDYDAAIEAWQTFVELAPARDPRVKQVQQSIKALRTARDNPQPQPTAPADGEDEDDAGSDDTSKDGDDSGDSEDEEKDAA